MPEHPNVALSRIEADDLINGRANGLSMAERGLLWILVRHVNRMTGLSCPSVDYLIALTGLAESTIHGIRKRLQDRGLVDWKSERRGQFNGPCIYTFNLSSLRAFEAPKMNRFHPPKSGGSHPPITGGSQAEVTPRFSESSPPEKPISDPPISGGELPVVELPVVELPEEERASAQQPLLSSVDLGLKKVRKAKPTPRPLTAAEQAIARAIEADTTLAPLTDAHAATIEIVRVMLPGTDAAREIAKAGAWCRTNPSKAPKAKGGAFLVRWFGRMKPDARSSKLPMQTHPDAPATFRKPKAVAT